MSAAAQNLDKIDLRSQLVSALLKIKPLANFAKYRARKMMITRAEAMGVPWRDNVKELQTRDWSKDLAAITNPDLTYPRYYLTSFHAYEQGNLSWDAAFEVESAAYAVHSRIWPDIPHIEGDPTLRNTFQAILSQHISTIPNNIVDLGCGVGMSTQVLRQNFPQATLTGIDLSPHFLAVAKHRVPCTDNITWQHAPAEATGLKTNSVDLVSACLMFHELPSSAAREIIQEARRLLRPGGHLAIMDMNPRSQVYAAMPSFILTLLKSTEPYLDQYFTLDLEHVLAEEGFNAITITPTSPRHRVVLAQTT
ncbi:MAG: class I SAM-dependent methyltransferase [Cyanobacteria bacterium P01_H01_bin.15]